MDAYEGKPMRVNARSMDLRDCYGDMPQARGTAASACLAGTSPKSTTAQTGLYGRRARNYALWSDCAPESWAHLLIAYMLICGTAGIAQDVAEPLAWGKIPLEPLWSGSRSQWSSVHPLTCLFSNCEYAARVMADLVLAAGGIVLLRKRQGLASILYVVWPLVSLEHIFHGSCSIADWREGGNSVNAALADASAGLWGCSLPLCALWAARRMRSGKLVRLMPFIAWMLVVYGLCVSLSYAIAFLDPGPQGLSANVSLWNSTWAASYLVGPSVPLACLVLGLWLLVTASKPLRACAWVLLVCVVARTIPGAILFGWGCWMAHDLLLALAFLVFVLVHRPRGDPTNPTCDSCGYSLRGLPASGHRCPECGNEFELIPEAARTADGIPRD